MSSRAVVCTCGNEVPLYRYMGLDLCRPKGTSGSLPRYLAQDHGGPSWLRAVPAVWAWARITGAGTSFGNAAGPRGTGAQCAVPGRGRCLLVGVGRTWPMGRGAAGYGTRGRTCNVRQLCTDTRAVPMVRADSRSDTLRDWLVSQPVFPATRYRNRYRLAVSGAEYRAWRYWSGAPSHSTNKVLHRNL